MVIVRVMFAFAIELFKDLPYQPAMAEDDRAAFGERGWHVASWYEYPAGKADVSQPDK